MDYLQYINGMVCSENAYSNHNFLVSGVDGQVRSVVGSQILKEAYGNGKTLFIVDNTGNKTVFDMFGAYHVVDVLRDGVNLCEGMFEVSSLEEISRIRSLLAKFGFEETEIMKIVRYLAFVRETERRLGNSDGLSVRVLEEYGGTELVNMKLRHLVENGKMTPENCEFLLSRYSEVSSSAADFEMFLVLIMPFLGTREVPMRNTAIRMPIGEYESDKLMKNIMCQIMASYIRRHAADCEVIVIDGGKGDRDCIVDFLKEMPTEMKVHVFSSDIFSLSEADVNDLMNMFSVRIYSRHENMASCAKIESDCGYVDVVKHSYSTTIDKRLLANSPWDLLFGTDRVVTEVRNAPVQEARYRKETINSLGNGTAIIDCGGVQTMFQF